MRIGATIATGIMSLLCTATALSDDLPVLPSPEEVWKLPKPSGFTDKPPRQLTRSSVESRWTHVPPLRSTASDSEAPIAFISIDADLLRAPLQADPQQEVLVVGAARPDPGPLTVQLGDRTFELAWVAETNEDARAVRHESMQVLNVPNGYARFSISGDDIVGTIVTPQETYRIVPDGPGRQAVFRASSRNSRHAAFKLRRKLPEADPSAVLERRHVQLEKLSEIQPKYVTGSDIGRYLYISGGALGKISGEIDAQKTLAILQALNDLGNVPRNLQIRIEKIGTQGSGQQIYFHQVIKGIAYFASNEIHTDRDGKIVSINAQFVDPDKAGDTSLLSESEAQKRAVRALEERISARLDEVELLKPAELFYYFEPSNQQLVPYYTFYLTARRADGSWAIRVNAGDGAARVLERPQEFGWRACGTVPPSSPLTCSDAGSDLIWYHTYNNPNGPQLAQCAYPRDPGNPNGKCRSGPVLRPNQALSEANVVLHTVQQTNPTVCCDQIGGADHILDVVVRTSATTAAAAYEPASESIMSNPDSAYLSNYDVVWHELGHHVLFKSATSFDFPSAYGASGEFFTMAFIEAFGDLMSAAISMNARQPTKDILHPGAPWIVGDGAAPPAVTPRNLADQTITSFYYLSSSNNAHDAGRAISKYFYNVFTTSGITGPRFSEVLLQVARQIRDIDQNRLDLMDVKAALLASTRAGETALVNAINARFSEMYDNIPGVNDGSAPIGVPAPPNTPPPPYPVTMTFTGNCPILNGARTSEWRVQWSPSPFAVSYRAFFKQVNGPLSDVATTSNTFILAQTNVQAQVSVAACGASGICGGSSARVLVNMRPECNF